MQSPLDQILGLLDSSPASLGIYLLSSILLVIGLVMTLTYWQQIPGSISRRLGLGLIFMLLVELVAFAVAMLVIDDPARSLLWLPPLDRFQQAFLLLWLLWIWGFPTGSSWADYLVGIFSFFLLVFFGLTLNLWSYLAGQIGFNAYWLDLAWQLSALIFLLVMSIYLYIKHPRLWGFGLLTNILLIIGVLLQVLVPSLKGNYAGPVRMFTLVALPLVLLLPQRFITPSSTIHAAELRRGEDKRDRRRYSSELQTALGFLSLAWEDNPHEAMLQLVQSIGRVMMADICLFTTLPDRNGQTTVLAGYDFLNKNEIPEFNFVHEDIPLITDALKAGKNLRLAESHVASPDITALCKLIKHEGACPVLAHPVSIPNAWKVGGILLMMPVSQRVWVPDDSNYLAALVEAMIRIIEHNQQQLETHTRFQKLTDDLRNSEQHISNLQDELHKLSVQLEAAQLQKGAKKDETIRLEPLLNAKNEATQTAERLEAENKMLLEELAQLKGVSSEEYRQHENQLEKELRLSLEEVARLKNILADADMKTRQLERELKARA